MKKKKIGGYIIIVLITIVVGIGIAYGINYFAKTIKNSAVVKKDNMGNSTNNEYANWTEYLLDQEITEIYIAVWGEDENGEYYSKNVNITKSELEDIFTKMTNGDLTKNYVSGGGDTTPDLIIKYESDNKEQTLTIKNGNELWEKDLDSKIIEFFDSEDYIMGENNSSATLLEYIVYEYNWNGAEYLNNIVNKNTTETNNTTNNEYANWTDYLLKQDIKEMYISKWGEDKNGEYYSKNVNITKSELEDIFAKMTNGKLTKNYIGGSGDSTPNLVVKYESNNKEYTLEIPYSREIWAEGLDPKLIELIELEDYKKVGTYDNINNYVVYVYDWDGTEYLNKLIENK